MSAAEDSGGAPDGPRPRRAAAAGFDISEAGGPDDMAACLRDPARGVLRRAGRRRRPRNRRPRSRVPALSAASRRPRGRHRARPPRRARHRQDRARRRPRGRIAAAEVWASALMRRVLRDIDDAGCATGPCCTPRPTAKDLLPRSRVRNRRRAVRGGRHSARPHGPEGVEPVRFGSPLSSCPDLFRASTSCGPSRCEPGAGEAVEGRAMPGKSTAVRFNFADPVQGRWYMPGFRPFRRIGTRHCGATVRRGSPPAPPLSFRPERLKRGVGEICPARVFRRRSGQISPLRRPRLKAGSGRNDEGAKPAPKLNRTAVEQVRA